MPLTEKMKRFAREYYKTAGFITGTLPSKQKLTGQKTAEQQVRLPKLPLIQTIFMPYIQTGKKIWTKANGSETAHP